MSEPINDLIFKNSKSSTYQKFEDIQIYSEEQ